MTLTVGRVLADAVALWRRDRDLLMRIGGPFLLLPSLALQLLAPPPLVDPNASFDAAVQARATFLGDHLAFYLVAAAAAQFGVAALTTFYCDRGARTLGDALRRAALLWPRFMIAAVLVQALAVGGLFVFLVGALLVLGRVLITGPLLVAAQPMSAIGAIARSVRATRGNTLTVAALAAIVTLAGPVAGQPFVALDGWLKSLHAPNPVALAVVDAAEAGVTMLAQIAAVLVAVATYRALARSSRGI